MIDAVIQPTDVIAAGHGSVEPSVRLRVPSVASVPVDAVPSEAQADYLRPEFTEALVKHMHEAKRLAIQDHQG